jgi:hypothetical protein
MTNLVLEGFHVDEIAGVGSSWISGLQEPFDWKAASRMLTEIKINLTRSEHYNQEEKDEAAWRIPIGDKEQGTLGMTQRATSASLQGYGEMNEAIKLANPDSELGSQKFLSYLGMMQTMWGARPFRSCKGYVGLVPDTSEEGDTIFIPVGSPVPFVIRKKKRLLSLATLGEQTNDASIRIDDSTPSASQMEHKEVHELVGEAYVHGIIDGEFPKSHPTLSLIHIPSPRDYAASRMPSSA